MTGTPIDKRTFTDEEVHEILKRAVAEGPSKDLVGRDGVSLAELKAIGSEVGIDTARLEDAARSLMLNDSATPSRLLGGPTSLGFERTVAGEFSSDDVPEIFAAIRKAMGVQGEIQEIHGALEWSATGDSSERYVAVSSRDGKTTVRASGNLMNGAVLTYSAAGVMGFLASMVSLVVFLKEGSMVGLVLALVLLPILYPLLRTVWSRISNSEAAKLRRAVDDVALLLEDSPR